MALPAFRQELFGLGLDLVSVETIRLALVRDKSSADAWLTPSEMELLGERVSMPHVLAGRIAAKEAVVKAIGSGFTDEVAWQDVEIIVNAAGAPTVALSGGALDIARREGITRVLVSISHLDSLAAATALAVR